MVSESRTTSSFRLLFSFSRDSRASFILISPLPLWGHSVGSLCSVTIASSASALSCGCGTTSPQLIVLSKIPICSSILLILDRWRIAVSAALKTGHAERIERVVFATRPGNLQPLLPGVGGNSPGFATRDRRVWRERAIECVRRAPNRPSPRRNNASATPRRRRAAVRRRPSGKASRARSSCPQAGHGRACPTGFRAPHRGW
jgi:hypothetical protein